MKDFKKLLIWQLGMEIVDRVYEQMTLLPQEEKYGLRSQMTRSAVSIPSNIAEGSAKKSVKEQVRFIEIALGSSFELETQLLVVQKRTWVEDAVMNELIESVRKEQRMISKFIEKLEG